MTAKLEKSVTVALNKCLEGFEVNILNPAGHYPLISIPFGITRIVYGNMQTATAMLATTINLTEYFLRKSISAVRIDRDNLQPGDVNIREEVADLTKCFLRVWRSCSYIPHGIANIARGCLEVSCVLGPLLSEFDSTPNNRYSYSPLS